MSNTIYSRAFEAGEAISPQLFVNFQGEIANGDAALGVNRFQVMPGEAGIADVSGIAEVEIGSQAIGIGAIVQANFGKAFPHSAGAIVGRALSSYPANSVGEFLLIHKDDVIAAGGGGGGGAATVSISTNQNGFLVSRTGSTTNSLVVGLNFENLYGYTSSGLIPNGVSGFHATTVTIPANQASLAVPITVTGAGSDVLAIVSLSPSPNYILGGVSTQYFPQLPAYLRSIAIVDLYPIWGAGDVWLLDSNLPPVRMIGSTGVYDDGVFVGEQPPWLSNWVRDGRRYFINEVRVTHVLDPNLGWVTSPGPPYRSSINGNDWGTVRSSISWRPV